VIAEHLRQRDVRDQEAQARPRAVAADFVRVVGMSRPSRMFPAKRLGAEIASVNTRGPMTKNELVRELAEELEVPRRHIVGIIEALLEKITGVLKAGDKVQLTPFGQFKIRDRAARVARNPQTGEPVNVPAKRVLKFIAGKPLKEAIGTPRRGAAKKAVPARKKVAGTSRKGAPARKVARPRKALSGKVKR
jgi:DNA-binding protein HU-beta